MKRLLPTLLTISFLVSNASLTYAEVHHGKKLHDYRKFLLPTKASISLLAPADEYFGQLKMSLLGIDNAIFNVVRRGTKDTMSSNTENSLGQVVNSIQDWEAHYPKDYGISRSLLKLHKAYASFPDQHANELALSTATWIIRKYPTSPQAHDARSFVAYIQLHKNNKIDTVEPTGTIPTNN